MKKISYLIICLLTVFVGLSSIHAIDCYKKTTSIFKYSTSPILEDGNQGTSVNKKFCNNLTPCYKHNYTKNTVYTTDCKAKTGENETTTCKKVSGSKCSNEANSGEVWNDEYNISSPTGLVYVACGKDLSLNNCNGGGTGAYDIPVIIPRLISFAVNALKIVTPVVLIIVGMIQMIKAVASSKEDEIKKAQSGLVKKIIIAIMIFFVIAIVQFAINKVADSSEKASLSKCLKCFLNNDCQLTYYRTGNNGEDCLDINTPNKKTTNNSSGSGSTTHESSSGATHGGGGFEY